MKWLLSNMIIILFLILTGCSEKNETADAGRISGGTTMNTEGNETTLREALEEHNTVIKTEQIAFERKIQEGEVILIYKKSGPAGIISDENQYTKLTLPDGKEYRARKDNDKTLLNIPGKGEMQIINLNDNFYVFNDDNQAFLVKYDKNRLFAELTNLSDELLKNRAANN